MADDRRASADPDGEMAPGSAAPEWDGVDLDDAFDREPADHGDPVPEDDADGEGLVATHVGLAMDSLRHHHGRAEPGDEPDSLYCFGSGDAVLYALEDGDTRLLVGRGVGRDDEGCIYCLVGSGPPGLLAALQSGDVAPVEAFDHAAELTLCSVFQADDTPRLQFRLSALNRPVSNVVRVQHYKKIEDVPVEYGPGEPFLRFTDG